MNIPFRWSAVATLSLSLSAIALAQAPVLDVKMGLWEIASTMNIGGQMPGMDTSKMTPEQKAQMDAAMKSMMAAHTTTQKTCVTREKFNKSNFMMDDQPGMTCKQTVMTNTRSTLDAKVVCTGERGMTMQMHVDALSQTAFKATMKSANTEQGKTMTIDGTMTGKWLAADCGDVK
jgi:ribosomal silencing factor RsfS